MKRGSRYHTGKGTWKPSDSDANDVQDPSSSAEPAINDGADDLDALLDCYAAEAHVQAKAAVQQASIRPGAGSKAQRESSAREQGLQQSLEPTNK